MHGETVKYGEKNLGKGIFRERYRKETGTQGMKL